MDNRIVMRTFDEQKCDCVCAYRAAYHSTACGNHPEGSARTRLGLAGTDGELLWNWWQRAFKGGRWCQCISQQWSLRHSPERPRWEVDGMACKVSSQCMISRCAISVYHSLMLQEVLVTKMRKVKYMRNVCPRMWSWRIGTILRHTVIFWSVYSS